MKIKTKLNKTEAVDKNGTIWNKEKLQDLLDRNDEAVYRAMLRIYARQTSTEQAYQATTDWNSVGFTGVDGEIMSSFSEAYKKYGRLTVKQMAIARKKMKKYWSQLLDEMRRDNPQILKVQ